MSAFLVLVLLTLAALAAVVQPLLRPPTGALAPLGAGAEARLALLEERDRAVAALKELEFDHRAGVVSDSDYRELVGPLRRQAAGALGALEHDA
jgi:hypothetical protein